MTDLIVSLLARRKYDSTSWRDILTCALLQYLVLTDFSFARPDESDHDSVLKAPYH